MKKHDRNSSLIWAAFGFYIAYEGYRLELGTPNNPGSGFLVFWAGLILALLSIALFAVTVVSKEEGGSKTLWNGFEWSKGMKLMLSLLIYTLVFRRFGFLLSTFLLLIYLFKGLEPQKWRVAFAFSIGTIAFCYLVFAVLLETQFPEGVVERLISR